MVIQDFDKATPLERNVPYMMFATTGIRQWLIDWESHAKRVLGEFRTDFGKNIDDPLFNELVAHLNEVSRDFRLWWLEHEVSSKGEIIKELDHPKVGLLRFEQTAFRFADERDIKIVFYMPLDDNTSRKLDDLYKNDVTNEEVSEQSTLHEEPVNNSVPYFPETSIHQTTHSN